MAASAHHTRLHPQGRRPEVIAQIEAGDLQRGDVVLVGRDQRRIERVDRCRSSKTDLHLIWQRGNVPLCIRPEAVVDTYVEANIEDVVVTVRAFTHGFKEAVAIAASAVKDFHDFTDAYDRVTATINGVQA